MTSQLGIVGVVAIGQFNPAIVHPAWLASQDLISRADADGATVEVVHPEVAQFALAQQGATLRVQVLRNRLHISTEDARLYEMARDLTIGVLTLLRHTPITKLGINWESHISLPSDDARNALGHRLAPTEAWDGIGEKGAAMLSLSMKIPRTDGKAGQVVVKIEPSVRVANGVMVAVNDHYDLDAVAPPGSGSESAIEILKLGWTASLKHAREMSSKLTGSA